ncbi:MAG: response regulator [bacterium]|nr:response regulator [bacterium]
MIGKRILVVEDNERSATTIKDALVNGGYEVAIANNGQSALDMFKEASFEVVITDIEMPVMDGNELISQLIKFPVEPLIFVLTGHEETDYIIDTMRKGVYDYLIKPIAINELLVKVERAFDAVEVKKTEAIMEKEKIIRLENQLEWYQWEDRVQKKDIKGVDKSLFHSLQTSFNQGAGFGSLITIANLILSSAEKEGEHYKIDAGIFDLLEDNVRMSEKALNSIRQINNIANRDLEMEDMTFPEFYEFIKKIVAETQKFADIRHQNIFLSDPKKIRDDIVIKVTPKYFHDAFYEALLNGCKFSEENTNIIVIMEAEADGIIISIINDPLVDQEGRKGVPIEYENIIFEPFFRLSKLVHVNYDSLDFGLGLTVVESVVKKMGGKVKISNIKDYSGLSKGSEVKVNLRISLPAKPSEKA